MRVVILLLAPSIALLLFSPPVRTSESSDGIKPWQRSSTRAFSEETIQNGNLTYRKMANTLRKRGYKVIEFPDKAPLVLVGDVAYLPEQVLPELAEGRLNGKTKITLWKHQNGTAIVTYYFHGNTTAGEIDMFRRAVETWKRNSCITFIELAPSPCTNTSDAICVGNFGGCWSSNMGKVDEKGRPQKLSVNNSSCTVWTTAMALGQTLGLNFQQCRPDRDKYVTVNYENFQTPHDHSNKSMKDLKKAWQEAECDENQPVDTPYDYMSVMHYESIADYGSDRPMFVTKDGQYQYLLQYRWNAGLTQSHYDFYNLNNLYGCGKSWKENCANAAPKCTHFGYMNKDCECNCPKAFNGLLCEDKNGPIFPLLDKAKVMLYVYTSQTIDMGNKTFVTEKIDGVWDNFKYSQYFTVIADGKADTQVSINIHQNVDNCPKLYTNQRAQNYIYNYMEDIDCTFGITLMWGLSIKGQLRVECFSSVANNETDGPMFRSRTNHMDLIYRSSIGMLFSDPNITIQLMRFQLDVVFSPSAAEALIVKDQDGSGGSGGRSTGDSAGALLGGVPVGAAVGLGVLTVLVIVVAISVFIQRSRKLLAELDGDGESDGDGDGDGDSFHSASDSDSGSSPDSSVSEESVTVIEHKEFED